MNYLDKAINFFSPKRAMERMRNRYLQSVFAQRLRRFDAAGSGRRTKNWQASGTDANVEIRRDGMKLRDRSREQGRNNPYARKALRTIPANVVGNGIRLSIDGKGSKRVMEKLKMLWKNWAEKRMCDFDERKTFYSIQRLCMRSILESGEVFVVQVRDASLKVPLQLQILEADFLDTQKDGIQVEGGGYIESGIEFNSKGKRVAYWMFSQHPGSNRVWKKLNSERVPASNVLHLYYEERPGQLAGVPAGAASMLSLRDFREYEDAQLIRQKIASCFTAFVTQAEEPGPGEKDANGLPMERVEPGIIEYLPPGREVTFGSPPPVENFNEYAEVTLRGIAAGYGMTYEAMTGDLSNVNFSSGRMGWIEFGRVVSEWQNEVMIPQLCDRVWEWFFEAVKVKGLIPDRLEVMTEWTPPRREMIDPVKEINGLKEMVRAGFNSWQDVIRQLGFDPRVVLSELESDQKEFDRVGLMLTSDARYDANRSDSTNVDENGDETTPKQAKALKKAAKGK